jgi:hypothetical protein
MGDFEGLEEAVADVGEQGALSKRDVEKPHVAGKANSWKFELQAIAGLLKIVHLAADAIKLKWGVGQGKYADLKLAGLARVCYNRSSYQSIYSIGLQGSVD